MHHYMCIAFSFFFCKSIDINLVNNYQKSLATEHKIFSMCIVYMNIHMYL